MAFTQLTEYSEGSLPECGMVSGKQYCSNVSSYQPIDVSGLEGEVSSKFQSATKNFGEGREQLQNQISNLDTEWGTKFASIDGSDLGIVDPYYFTDKLDIISRNINDQQAKCELMVSKIVSRTDQIKQYLNTLNSNYQEYEKFKTQRDDLLKDREDLVSQHNNSTNAEEKAGLKSSIAELDAQITDLENLLSLYQELQEPDGSWVLG